MARQVGLPQVITKMTEMNTRLKECERNKGYVTLDDVNNSVDKKLQSITSQKNNYATNDDLEDKFQKYKGQVASFKKLTTQMLETIDSLRSEINSSKAHHDALVLRVNELKEKESTPSE